MLAKHETLEEAVDEICAAMSKKKEDPVRVRGGWRRRCCKRLADDRRHVATTENKVQRDAELK